MYLATPPYGYGTSGYVVQKITYSGVRGRLYINNPEATGCPTGMYLYQYQYDDEGQNTKYRYTRLIDRFVVPVPVS
jgi:hypothetical protein